MRTVVCAEGLYEPSGGILAYLRRYPPTGEDPVRLLFGVRRTPPPPELRELAHVRIASFLPGRGLRGIPDLVNERYSYREVCDQFATGAIAPHAVVAAAGPTRRGAARSLGVINGYLQLAIDGAEVVVVEQRADLPHVRGAAVVPDAAVVVDAADSPGFTGLSGAPDETSLQIAAHVAELLPSRCTISLGVGRVSDAVAELCHGFTGVRLICGAIGEAARGLAASDTLDRAAPIEAMSVVGDERVTSWAVDDRRVRLLPSTTIHDPAWLGSHERFSVVLGALNVDRAGNVNSERAGGRWLSGLGGAPDFARGAHLSSGGRCIVALPARGPNGRSNLAEALEAVTVPANLVDAIVTEKGAAVYASRTGRWQPALEEIFQ